jgi:hypothetical protein
MIISDLNHLETVSDNTNVSGGTAFADAYAKAGADGKFFAATVTGTYSYAGSSFFWSTARSGSVSSSVAF